MLCAQLIDGCCWRRREHDSHSRVCVCRLQCVLRPAEERSPSIRTCMSHLLNFFAPCHHRNITTANPHYLLLLSLPAPIHHHHHHLHHHRHHHHRKLLLVAHVGSIFLSIPYPTLPAPTPAPHLLLYILCLQSYSLPNPEHHTLYTPSPPAPTSSRFPFPENLVACIICCHLLHTPLAPRTSQAATTRALGSTPSHSLGARPSDGVLRLSCADRLTLLPDPHPPSVPGLAPKSTWLLLRASFCYLAHQFCCTTTTSSTSCPDILLCLLQTQTLVEYYSFQPLLLPPQADFAFDLAVLCLPLLNTRASPPSSQPVRQQLDKFPPFSQANGPLDSPR